MRAKDFRPGLVVAIHVGDRIAPVRLTHSRIHFRGSGLCTPARQYVVWHGRALDTGREVTLRSASRARYPMVEVGGKWVQDPAYTPPARRPRPSAPEAPTAPEDVDDILRVELFRNVLRYACGRAITCPGCGTVLDAPRAVVLVDRVYCTACFDRVLPTLSPPAIAQLETLRTSGDFLDGRAIFNQGV